MYQTRSISSYQGIGTAKKKSRIDDIASQLMDIVTGIRRKSYQYY